MLQPDLIEFANYLADAAGEISRKYFRKNISEFEKEDRSPVTIADIEIEDFIREEIKARYPAHGIFGEEGGELAGNSAYKWFIDPIDGTSAFISGKPTFTNLIALTYNDVPILSIVNQPITNERWFAAEAQGAFLNKQPSKTRLCPKLANAILNTTSPNLFSKAELSRFNMIAHKTKYQKYGGVFFGGDAYAYGLLASGHIDVIIESGLKAYDFMPLILLVKAAGGIITNWQGEELNANSKGQILAVGDKKLHAEIVSLLNVAVH